jgi:hypothetical protein
MTVHIARCPEHGLHGERSECFICGGEVEQVEMASVDVDAATDRVMALMVRTYGAMPSEETRLQARRLALAALYEVADPASAQQARPVRPKASNPQPERAR